VIETWRGGEGAPARSSPTRGNPPVAASGHRTSEQGAKAKEQIGRAETGADPRVAPLSPEWTVSGLPNRHFSANAVFTTGTPSHRRSLLLIFWHGDVVSDGAVGGPRPHDRLRSRRWYRPMGQDAALGSAASPSHVSRYRTCLLSCLRSYGTIPFWIVAIRLGISAVAFPMAGGGRFLVQRCAVGTVNRTTDRRTALI
jgi:hypothetical protein